MDLVLLRILIAVALAAMPLQAQKDLPDLAPVVRSLAPLGGRVGETIEIKLAGKNLEGVTALEFAQAGLRGEVTGSSYSSAKARVSIAASVPAGIHEFRLISPRGVAVGVFHAGSLPRSTEAEPNNDLQHAQALAMPTILDGLVTGGDYDVFRFHAEAGQVLVFDLLGTRAHSRLDATLAVLDERGAELDFVDDYYIHKDPHLEFTAKRAGDYFLRVAGSGERGSKDSSYRLFAGALPYVHGVLPVGAKRGADTELTVRGVNLSGLDKVTLEGGGTGKVLTATANEARIRLSVPAGAATGAHLLHLFAGSVEAPVPVQVLVADTSELLSSSAPRSAPQALALPAAVSGVLSTRKAAHYYSIDAQAGERIAFEVDAMKLGYLLDPVLAVYASDGKLVASADDRVQQNGAQPPNLDPYLVHKFEQAGRYTVMIRDMAERSSPDYVYRLTIYRTEPDFDWKTLQPSISIYTGMKSLLAVRVRRLGGWDTPIDVWLEDLPPGVTAEKQTAEPKDTIVKDNCALERKLDGTDVYIPVIAAKDAAAVVFKPKLRARGTIDGKKVEHTAEVQFLWESVGKVSGRTEDQTVVATVSPAPALMLEAPGQVSLSKGKPARVRVLVKRFDGSAGPLRLELDKPVSGLTLENTEVAPGASQVTLRLTADAGFRAATIRLRSGLAVSPPIELKAEAAEESDR